MRKKKFSYLEVQLNKSLQSKKLRNLDIIQFYVITYRTIPVNMSLINTTI